MSPKLVLCGSTEMAPPNAEIPSANHDDAGAQRLQGSNNHPIKVLHRFPLPLQVGFPKAETKSALAWNINLILLRLETYITMFC